jgi:hypothetical protein
MAPIPAQRVVPTPLTQPPPASLLKTAPSLATAAGKTTNKVQSKAAQKPQPVPRAKWDSTDVVFALIELAFNPDKIPKWCSGTNAAKYGKLASMLNLEMETAYTGEHVSVHSRVYIVATAIDVPT